MHIAARIQTDCFLPDLDKKKLSISILRDDLIPFSFGGNKVRKAFLFFQDLQAKGCNYVITYGSNTSNHCRVVANLAAQKSLPCLIISPNTDENKAYNQTLVTLSGADITTCELEKVKETIYSTLERLQGQGFIPYFIPGGGHGNLGTEAYVSTYEEIVQYEKANDTYFEYIFLASGTGTTQAGLICGKLLHADTQRNIIGISIARKNPRASNIIQESVTDYLLDKGVSKKDITNSIICLDDYTCGGYGQYNNEISDLIINMYKKHGIPLDPTYTGKAFWGMLEFCKENQISNKNILFIHTGGTPLFFDFLKGQYEEH
jgi:D-cysteine desulfhydrase